MQIDSDDFTVFKWIEENHEQPIKLTKPSLQPNLIADANLSRPTRENSIDYDIQIERNALIKRRNRDRWRETENDGMKTNEKKKIEN